MMPQRVQLSVQPIYLQVRHVLAERIAKGDWKPGANIPNETDLAREFGVSPGTMRKALDLLESEHLVVRRQGRGTFVNDQSSDEFAFRFFRVFGPDGKRLMGGLKLVEVTTAAANETERLRLGLDDGHQVYRIRRIRHVSEQPFMFEEAARPVCLFRDLARDEVVDRLVCVARKCGLFLGSAQERLSIEKAPRDVAEALDVDEGAPIGVLDRLVRTTDGRAIEWRRGWCDLTSNYYLATMD
jgi:GntR family transcriptional regulator